LAEPTTNRGFFATRYNGVCLPSATTSSCVNSIEPQPFTTRANIGNARCTTASRGASSSPAKKNASK
jgi:hypothetical protein